MVGQTLGISLGAVASEFAAVVAAAAFAYGAINSLSALVVEEAAFHKYRSWGI